MIKRTRPKGVWTPLKVAKLNKLHGARLKRVEKIRDNFQTTAEASKQLRLMEKSAQTVSKLNAIKPSERGAGHGKKLKSAYLQNATSYFFFLEGFLDFAKKQNASHNFINSIESKLNSAQEEIVRVKEYNF